MIANRCGRSEAAASNSNTAPGGEPLVVRLQPYELDLLDAWKVEQDDIPETRQDAIRGLIAMVCGEGRAK